MEGDGVTLSVAGRGRSEFRVPRATGTIKSVGTQLAIEEGAGEVVRSYASCASV